MKVIAISTLSTTASYMLRRIHSFYPLERVFKINLKFTRSKRRSLRDHIGLDRIAQRLEQRLFYRALFAKQERELKRLLLADSHLLPPLPEVIELDSDVLNTEETANLLRQVDPDVSLVCCAPLLKPLIFMVPKYATLNVHFGVAPSYRGENTLFWPLYFGDYDRLGLTIHEIDKGIDTGPVLSHIFLDTEPSDTETTLLAKASSVGADAIAEILRAYPVRRPRMENLSQGGKEFRMRDRRIWHDLQLQASSLVGRNSPPSRAGRIVHYWQDSAYKTPLELV